MTENKYLPIGSTIAKKYEVIDILGEDEFEILYLVRDLHRKGSFFVLKELFLETFSARTNQVVYTLPEAEGVFDKRKKQIIEEIEAQKLNLNLDEIKVYGYEEDNNTIYTIMAFSNNASLEKYLQYTPKDINSLPTLDELLNAEKKGKSIFFFLKLLLFIGIILVLIFFVHQYFQKDSIEEKLKTSATMDYPKLQDRTKIKKEIEIKESIKVLEVLVKPMLDKQVAIKYEDNISAKLELVEEVEIEENLTTIITKDIKSVVMEEVALKEIDMNTSVIETNQTVILKEKKIEENLTIVDDEISIQTSMKSFLDAYIDASASTVEGTLKFYDKEVQRYFKLKNATHKSISNSQKRYNRKWIKREFKISDFKIMKSYKKDNINYFDIKTTTVWSVSNKRGKKLSTYYEN
jgi:hypothetical protein